MVVSLFNDFFEDIDKGIEIVNGGWFLGKRVDIVGGIGNCIFDGCVIDIEVDNYVCVFVVLLL